MLRHSKSVAVLQVLFYSVMILVNTLANALPLNGYNTGEISAMYPNLFVPAGFTFSIWGILYLLLLGWVIYSGIILWKQKQTILFNHIRKVAPFFTLSCTLNAVWIMWHQLLPVAALLIMFWLLSTLITIYRSMQAAKMQLNTRATLLLYIPFVMYLAWICVASIANTTAVLVDIDWKGFGMQPWLWSCIMIVIAALLGCWFSLVKREAAFAVVVGWALFGIYKGQQDTVTVSYTAGVSCGLVLLAGLIGLVKKDIK
jgi:translocator protein